MISVLVLVSLLTFLHYVGAQMRAAPVLPLYAAAHGASATGVGLIIGAHMTAAGIGSIPLGRASDIWGRRPLLLGGMAVGIVTSLFLPLVEGELALMTIYGLAGFGVAAFTPSALSLVGDAAAPGSKRCVPYAIGGVLMGSAATALLPLVKHQAILLGLAAVFGAVSGIAFVAISVALAASATPAARGLVMGGYSTSLYLGLALGSFSLGPIITHQGYAVGFAAGGAASATGTLIAALLWATAQHPSQEIGGRVTGEQPFDRKSLSEH